MRFLKGAAYAIFLIALFAGSLKLVDVLVLERRGRGTGHPAGDPPDLTVFQKDLYPYTGGHTQADFVVSPQVRTGDHGFFVDFDLDQPPRKEAGELRLILTGGSAAAGWGATSNEAMLYRRLEEGFNRTRPCGSRAHLKVINLAMGDSMSYQNYIALNRWGHPLAPDLIMSFSGLNDINVPYNSRSDAYRDFDIIRALEMVARFSSSGPGLKRLGEFYPGLIKNTSVGMSIRTLQLTRTVDKARAEYLRQFPAVRTIEELEQRVIQPLYVHSLQSIKRDFLGIPVAVVFQPYTLTPEAPSYRDWRSAGTPAERALMARWRVDVGESVETLRRVYANLKSYARPRLAHYLNDKWVILDMDQYYQDRLAQRFAPGDGIHLGDEQQRLVAEAIGAAVFPAICGAKIGKERGS